MQCYYRISGETTWHKGTIEWTVPHMLFLHDPEAERPNDLVSILHPRLQIVGETIDIVGFIGPQRVNYDFNGPRHVIADTFQQVVVVVVFRKAEIRRVEARDRAFREDRARHEARRQEQQRLMARQESRRRRRRGEGDATPGT